MQRRAVILSLCLPLAACGSRLNPLNWFGGEREVRVDAEDTVAAAGPVDPRPLVTEIVELSVEATSSGALVRAVGRVPATGYFDAALVEAGRTESELVLEFRAQPPEGGGLPGSERTRELVAAYALRPRDLGGLRTITVIGQANRRSVTRR